MSALLVAAGAAVGAPLRFWLATWLDDPERLPWGTLLVNVVGSFLLGVLSARDLGTHATALLAVGFCGGVTTYSAFAVQTVGLGRRGVAYVALTLAACVAAAALGFVL